MDNNIRDNASRFALLGRGISYSVSPMLHTELLKRKGISITYDIIDRDDIDKAVCELRAYDGFNVTKPYKVDIIDYLDDIDDGAKAIGSVNTVTNIGGRLKGYNTDLDGILDTFRLDNINVSGKRVLVIGYGGVAKTIIYALKTMGAGVIAVTGRNISKMLDFKAVAFGMGIDLAIDKDIVGKYDIVINATTVGTGDDENMPIDPDKLEGIEYYFDLIYTPRRTSLMRELERKGVKVRDGLYMLVSQAAGSDRYYLDIDIDCGDVVAVYSIMARDMFLKNLAKKSIDNIVLVGFMGAGKSTIGRRLADLLDIEYIDTDNVIEDRFGSISEIFREHGEDHFRDIETDVLKDVIGKKAVISTGGGIVMRDENIDIMKRQNSLVIFLNTSFDTIKERVKGSDRPLFRDETKARALYDYRYNRYADASDFLVDSTYSEDAILDIFRY